MEFAMTTTTEPRWKSLTLLAITIASTLIVFLHAPIPQAQDYHRFADEKVYGGIPHTLNVLSNLAFLWVGLLGLVVCRQLGNLRNRIAWTITFVGIALVSLGSAYYHWAPNDQSLVWDRLPMTIAFMAFLSALLGEYLGERITRIVLLPSLLMGISSVVYWYFTNDLRWYAWVVFVPLILIIALLALYKSVHRTSLLLMLAFYVAAKLGEAFDAPIYSTLGNLISGHSIKHLLAAVACYWMVRIVRRSALQG